MPFNDVAVCTFDDGAVYAVELIPPVGEIVGSAPTGGERLTSPTGVRDRATRSVTDLSNLLAHVASEIGRSLVDIDATNRPSSVEAEISLGLSGQLGPVLLASGTAECSVRAKLVWEADALDRGT
jgi:hypothetical protein